MLPLVRSIIEPVRHSGFHNEHDFHLAEAIRWDPQLQKVHCRSTLSDREYSLSYDKLVIAVGALPNTFSIPGVVEHAVFLKEIADAQRIRAQLISNFERSLEPGISDEERESLLHVIIVGGGPTGVEFGAELYDFIQQDIGRLYKTHSQLLKVTLIESHQILAAFDSRLRNYAHKKMASRKNFNMLKTAVTSVGKDHVVTRDGVRLPCGLVVWSAGLAPRNFTQNLAIKTNPQGQIVTDSWLSVADDPLGNTFALGDCADIDSIALPCTAQVAERQGAYLARCLNEDVSKGTPPFTFKSMGMLAYIGDYQALSDLPEFKLSGFSSWFLWRSAYLTRLGSWRLRMQVPLDWLKTLLFGRDTSKF